MATSFTWVTAATKPEPDANRRDPTKTVCGRVVEVYRRWFNRFRSVLVRYENLVRSFVALNCIGAAINAFRRVRLKVDKVCK